MDFREFTCAKDDDGKRLDKIIKHIIPSQNLSAIYKSIRKGLIRINQKSCKPDSRIAEGDVISVAEFLLQDTLKAEQTQQNELLQSQIDTINEQINRIRVFENEHLLVLNKESGINVHSSTKTDFSLQKLVEQYYRANFYNDSLTFTPGPLHRIDRFTCGLICFSKSTAGARWFSDCIKNHSIKKTYAAVVQGKPEINSTYEWKDYLLKPDVNNSKHVYHTVQVWSEQDKNYPQQAKLCITRMLPKKSIEYNNIPATICDFEIETGRQHQIRAQASFHGYPLLADTAYGAKKTDFNDGHFFLCAYKLEFPENSLGIPKTITIALPDFLIYN